MPNLCSNNVTIRAKTKTRLNEIIHDLWGVDDNHKQLVFDFNKLIPRDENNRKWWAKVIKIVPKVGEPYTTGYGADGCAISVDKMIKTLKRPRKVSLKDVVGVQKMSRYRAAYLIGYAFNWYGWQCSNWGVKWNAAYGFRDKPHRIDGATGPYKWEANFSFDTPWDAPIPVLEALCKKYGKECDIYGSYSEEGNGFRGEWSADDEGGFIHERSNIEPDEDEQD